MSEGDVARESDAIDRRYEEAFSQLGYSREDLIDKGFREQPRRVEGVLDFTRSTGEKLVHVHLTDGSLRVGQVPVDKTVSTRSTRELFDIFWQEDRSYEGLRCFIDFSGEPLYVPRSSSEKFSEEKKMEGEELQKWLGKVASWIATV